MLFLGQRRGSVAVRLKEIGVPTRMGDLTCLHCPPSASLTLSPPVSQAPFPREEISYAALSLAGLGQEPTYSNTVYPVAHVPRTVPEETTEYSSVRRPLPAAMP